MYFREFKIKDFHNIGDKCLEICHAYPKFKYFSKIRRIKRIKKRIKKI